MLLPRFAQRLFWLVVWWRLQGYRLEIGESWLEDTSCRDSEPPSWTLASKSSFMPLDGAKGLRSHLDWKTLSPVPRVSLRRPLQSLSAIRSALTTSFGFLSRSVDSRVSSISLTCTMQNGRCRHNIECQPANSGPNAMVLENCCPWNLCGSCLGVSGCSPQRSFYSPELREVSRLLVQISSGCELFR